LASIETPGYMQAENNQLIDYRRVSFKIIDNWYWILLFLSVCLSTAFLVNRYATKVYPVTMSIIIKEGQEASGNAGILYNNPLVDPYRNFYNERYLLKAYPLINDVINELNFMVSFYNKGKVKISEDYSPVPIDVRILSGGEKNNSQYAYELKILSPSRYSIATLGEDDEVIVEHTTYSFYDTVRIKNTVLTLHPNENADLTQYINSTYNFKYVKASALVRSYMNRLQVDWAEEGASVVDLAINGSIPKKEIDFLNMLVDKYSARDLERKVLAAQRSIEFIEEQLANITDSLLVYESELQDFKSENKGDELGVQSLRLLERLEVKQQSKSEITIHQNYLDHLETYINEGQNLDQIILPSAVGISDPILTSLIQNMLELQLRVQSSSSLENPLLNSQLASIEALKQKILESIRGLKGINKINETGINKEIHLIENELGTLPAAERTLLRIRRNFSLHENLYIFLMQKRAEAGITKASTVTDIHVVNPPMVSGRPVYPNTVKNIGIGLLLGLGAPIGLLVALELLNNKIQSKEDVEKLTKIPIIGGIGHKSINTNLVVNQKPKSAIAESFRSLRSNLNYFTDNQDQQLFLISSSISGEGKSFTTMNLGIVFALSGKKVLIIGADMRKPKIYNDFDLTNDFGLSTYLSNSNTYDEVIQQTQIENLDFISSGPIPPNPSELLLKNEMEKLISKASSQYNFILLDTPPISLVTDAFILSKYSDHTVFVTRQNYTPKQSIENIDELFQAGKIKNISILINDIKNEGYGYGYNYGYSYHDDQSYYEMEPKKSRWATVTRLFKKSSNR